MRRIVSSDDFVLRHSAKKELRHASSFPTPLRAKQGKKPINQKNSDILHIEVFFHLARRDGFEPATASFEDSCSVQLSYRRTPRIISLSSRSCRMNQSLLSGLFLGDDVEFFGLLLENDDGE